MTNQRRNTAVRFLAKCSFGLLIIAALTGFYLHSLTLPAAKSGDIQEFVVNKGESSQVIANNLQKAGLIRSSLYFRFLVKEQKLMLQAGVYQVSPTTAPNQIAVLLTEGKAADVKITIPEGYRAEQIAETAGLPTKDFMSAAKGLEGQLFPDTYFVKKGITAAELVKIMHDNFSKKVGNIDTKTLILASLVERETRGVPEKPIVAGILQKRLAANWPLELDATIQYSLGTAKNWWPDTTLLDRKTPSKYNTYLNLGLPPTPICNPGLAAINAVRSAESSPYWFYLHDKSGVIHYAVTSTEQDQNIATYIH